VVSPDSTVVNTCSVFGKENVTEAEPTMGGEDFAFYTQKIPGAMIFVGHGDPATNYPLHNPNFMLDDSVLPRGARLLAELAFEYLSKGGFQTPESLSADSGKAGEGIDVAGSESGAGREEL
jgi:Peptidase family M20/M25/M40